MCMHMDRRKTMVLSSGILSTSFEKWSYWRRAHQLDWTESKDYPVSTASLLEVQEHSTILGILMLVLGIQFSPHAYEQILYQ